MTERSPIRDGFPARLDANGAGGGSPGLDASTTEAPPRTIRLGRISYVNMAPVFFRLEAEVDEVAGVPTELSRRLLAGEIDVAPIPSIEYARNAARLRLLPRLCVSSEGAVDSIQLVSRLPLERVGTIKAFREFVIGVTSFIKQQEITGLFTSTTATLLGGSSITETHISTLTDSIILLRYVEMFGEMKRGITVLKMRGSTHHKGIREFTIDGTGMHLGRPFRNVTGILAGTPVHVSPSDIERVWSQLDAEVGEGRRGSDRRR